MLREQEETYLLASQSGPDDPFWQTFDDADPKNSRKFKAGFCVMLGTFKMGEAWYHRGEAIYPGANTLPFFREWSIKSNVDVSRFLNLLKHRISEKVTMESALSARTYSEAMFSLLEKLNDALQGVVEPVEMVIAGGAAVYHYTQSRVTEDVDATYSKRFMVPDLQEPYLDERGKVKFLYFDKNYNDTFALMHENYLQDAQDGGEAFKAFTSLRVKFLSPTDLAVSKISRMSEQDVEDVVDLAKAGLIDAEGVEKRALEALGGFVGNTDVVRSKIDYVVRKIRECRNRTSKPPV